MKKIVFILLTVFIFSCANTKKINQTMILPNTNQEILIGKINKAGLKSGIYAEWFNNNYNDYQVENSWFEQMPNNLLKDVKIKLIMATWCGDSKREVPRFYKIIEASGFSEKKLEIIAVDRTKKAEGFDLQNLSIERVPTFIFYKENKEIGRIIETPQTTLEGDMIQILQKK
jgi:thiol-disulfide isomerase/thioredoxin